MGASFTICSYNPSFAADIASIEAECFGVNAWSEQAVASSAARPDFFYYCAVKDGVCVGYLCGYSVLDEFDICNLAVSSSSRRQGIAESLLKALFESAKEKGITHITLEVRASNTAAVSLYEKAGFSLCGKRRAFYSHPTEDALLYEKNALLGMA